MPRAEVPLQRLDGLSRGLLQPADGGFYDPTTRQPIGGPKLGQAQPAMQCRFADAGPRRGRGVRRFSQQGSDKRLLLAAQFFPVASHLLSSALIRTARAGSRPPGIAEAEALAS